MTFHRKKVLPICGNSHKIPAISRFSQPAISRFFPQFPAFILTTFLLFPAKFPQFPATIPTIFPQIPTNKSGILEVALFSCGTSHIFLYFAKTKTEKKQNHHYIQIHQKQFMIHAELIMSDEEESYDGLDDGTEDEDDVLDWQLPLCFMKKRHKEKIDSSKYNLQPWRLKEKVKYLRVNFNPMQSTK